MITGSGSPGTWTVAALEAFVPRLWRVLEDSEVLLVLDNLETLLTPEGAWRDPWWEPLMGVLAGHGGESKLILTSRIPPAAPRLGRVPVTDQGARAAAPGEPPEGRGRGRGGDPG